MLVFKNIDVIVQRVGIHIWTKLNSSIDIVEMIQLKFNLVQKKYSHYKSNYIMTSLNDVNELIQSTIEVLKTEQFFLSLSCYASKWFCIRHERIRHT